MTKYQPENLPQRVFARVEPEVSDERISHSDKQINKAHTLRIGKNYRFFMQNGEAEPWKILEGQLIKFKSPARDRIVIRQENQLAYQGYLYVEADLREYAVRPYESGKWDAKRWMEPVE